MNEKQKSLLPGVVLILIGTCFLLNEMNLFYFRWRHVYPIGMLAVSALLFIRTLKNDDKSGVFPATILFVVGAFFLFRNFRFFSIYYLFYDVEEFWPIFLIAVGMAFIVLFFFKRDDWGLIIPGGVLLFFGITFLLRTSGLFYWGNVADFWPLILIAIGIAIVVKSLKGQTQ